MIEKTPSLFDDPKRAWEPYEPGPDAPWNAARVAHLHRRAGFGATWGQLQSDLAEGYEPSIHRILEGEPHGPGGQPAAEFTEIVTAMEDSARRRPSIERDQMLWLYRLIFTPHPLAEVMTLAWHSHYATSEAKVNSPELMLEQNLAIRKLWRAPISQLHRAILHDGAMLRWLDGLNSTKEYPNENLAREFLELFALGEGNYTERDVHEVARALTGWRQVEIQEKKDGLDESEFDAGPKTILGQTGPWGRDDVVRIACRQSAAATHIARRLCRTFVSNTDELTPELLGPLAEAMRVNGDVDVARGIETVLHSRLFHSDECRARHIRSPADLAIGAIRACEAFAPPPDVVELEIHLTKMGQRLFFPSERGRLARGLAWLRGSTVLARANFAAWLTGAAAGLSAEHFRGLARRHGLKSLEAWLDAKAVLLTGVELSADRKAEVLSGAHGRSDPDRPFAQIVKWLLSLPEAQMG